MPIHITLEEVLAAKGMTAKEVARLIDMSETQLSLFRSGKVRGIRFSTLAKLCAVLDCQPGDLLGYGYAAADLAYPDDNRDGRLSSKNRRED